MIGCYRRLSREPIRHFANIFLKRLDICRVVDLVRVCLDDCHRAALPERPINFGPSGTFIVPGRPTSRRRVISGRDARLVPLQDAELIEKVKAGQTEAYGELVRKYQDRLFNTCWRICGHLEDARDLTQEAFLKAFERLGDFRGECGFYTWLYRIAVNLALTHRRDAARRRVISLDHSAGVAGTQAEGLAKRVGQAGRNEPAEAASEAELHGFVTRALQALDDDHRAVIVLRDLQGLGYQEIGEILEIPPGTVRSRLHRARMALSKVLPSVTAQEP